MEKATYKPIFNRKKNLLEDGTALVQIETYLNRQRRYFTTSIYITLNQWDKKRRRVKNHPNDIKLNKQITDIISRFESFELDMHNAGKAFSLDMLTDVLEGKHTSSFIQFMENEIKDSTLKMSTRTTQSNTLKGLKEFRKEIHFNELNYKLLSEFEKYLTNKGLAINTINKYFRHVRTFINLAINKDMFELNQYPFRKFKAKSEETIKTPLTPEELTLIENITFTQGNKHLEKIRDMFLFACYTGLRFSDVVRIRPDHIVLNDGVQYVDLTKTTKTGTPVKIPISLLFDGKPVEIMQRYKPHNKKYYFDDLTNQYVNRSLKEISELAGINKKITFHMGRHTQATYLLNNGVSLLSVKKILGHKKTQTTEIYAKMLNHTVNSEIEKAFAK